MSVKHVIGQKIELTHSDDGVNAFFTALEGGLITDFVVYTREAFDGTTPTLTIETVGGSAGDIAGTGDSDLTNVGGAGSGISRIFDADTDIQVTLNAGGSTTGKVQIVALYI